MNPSAQAIMHAVSITFSVNPVVVMTTQMIHLLVATVAMTKLLAQLKMLTLELWERLVVMLLSPASISLTLVSLKTEDQVKVCH